MRLVVDANTVIAALLGTRMTIKIITLEQHTLLAPVLLLEEINKHKKLLEDNTERKWSVLKSELLAILFFIQVVDPEIYFEYRSIVHLRDIHDIDYVACALACNASIWSNDKDLHDQAFVPAFTTQMLSSSS